MKLVLLIPESRMNPGVAGASAYVARDANFIEAWSPNKFRLIAKALARDW